MPIEKVVSRWISWGESGSSGFTCHCVRMQWVAHTNSTINTCTSILQYTPWQDSTTISAPDFNFKNYCTSSDFGACPNTGKFTTNPQSPPKMIHLLTPKPQKKNTDRFSSVMVPKYQKLCSNFKRIFSSNKVMLAMRTVFATKSNSQFLRRRRRFTTLVHPISIKLPRRRPVIAPNKPIKPSKGGNPSRTRRCRYFSVQL